MSFDFGTANEKQINAIKTTEGPLLVVAGPGTGKTFTLIKRAMYLIETKGIKPENIMLVTFTEKAAKEIITRLSNELLEKNINLNVNEMYVGTIHSVCLRILKENLEFASLKKNYQVYDDFDQQYFLYQNYWSHFRNIENIDLIIDPVGSIWDRVSRLKKYINLISEELVDIDRMITSDEPLANVIGSVLKKYNELRIQNNFIDFSTIQTETFHLLSDLSNGVLEKLQNKIQYVMVDEYQDTNYIQEQLAFLISNKNNNICVVGDDDQGLYRFRGATIRNILEFESKFSNCKKVILNDNYRSEEGIIQFYNQYMSTTTGRNFAFEWDEFRFDKSIIASKRDKGKHNPVVKIEGTDYEDLNQQISDFIFKLRDTGTITNYNQIAFLFRSVKNDKIIELSKHLEKTGINVYSPRSDLFFQRDEIKLIIGTLLLMFPAMITEIWQNDKKWFVDLYNYYRECISKALSEIQKEENSSLSKFVKTKAYDHRYLPEQSKALDYSVSQLVYQLLQFDLFANIVTVDVNNGLAETLQSRNVSILIHTIIKFEFSNNINILTPNNINRAVNRLFSEFLLFLYEGGISEYEDESEYAPSGCVSFLTIHQSKGMEFPIVLVGSLFSNPRENLDEILCFVEDKFANRTPFEPRGTIKFFDFWRLYYTAFSRAQNLLVLIGSSQSRGISKYFEESFSALSGTIEYDDLIVSDIKDSKLKPQYSFTSDVQLYENCQTQYLFFRELGYEQVSYGTTLFGSLVHETIEDIHKAVLRKERDRINPDAINMWMTINYQTISRREKKYLSPQFLETAYKQVLSYFNKRQSQWSMIREAEIPVSLVKDKYILSGKIDLIQGDDDTYEIVDFKTEKKPDMFNDVDKIEVSRRQLEVYAHILKERYGYEISKLKIYYTSETDSNPIIEFKKDDYSINKTIDRFSRVVSQIEDRQFGGKAKDRKICSHCDLRFYCKTNQEG
jgi:DNA helicase II / ATP-dependent DNA helicase PcrA